MNTFAASKVAAFSRPMYPFVLFVWLHYLSYFVSLLLLLSYFVVFIFVASFQLTFGVLMADKEGFARMK